MEITKTRKPPEDDGVIPPGARERILRTASSLFYLHGIHTVGIDRIIAESGVAKMTFYKYFPSKAKLVADYLHVTAQATLQHFREASAAESLSPVDRVLSLFDVVEAATSNAGFRGCPFIRGLSDFMPDRDEPEVKAQVAEYFVEFDALVRSLVAPLRLLDEDSVVASIQALIHGSIVLAQASRPGGVSSSRRTAAMLLSV